MADIAASVLAKLKNKAKASGISYQQCLQLFFQEEFLRKLADSKYAENFVLKGGLFIYTLTNFESRATVDVDFLMRGLNNDLDRMDEIIAEILSVPTGNDCVTFKASKTEPIAVQRKYHGQHPDHRLHKKCACAVQRGYWCGRCHRPSSGTAQYPDTAGRLRKAGDSDLFVGEHHCRKV